MATATDKDAPYRELQRHFARHPLGAPPTDTFLEILKFYYEPDEAHLAASMDWELEPEDVAALSAAGDKVMALLPEGGEEVSMWHWG